MEQLRIEKEMHELEKKLGFFLKKFISYFIFVSLHYMFVYNDFLAILHTKIAQYK